MAPFKLTNWIKFMHTVVFVSHLEHKMAFKFFQFTNLHGF